MKLRFATLVTALALVLSAGTAPAQTSTNEIAKELKDLVGQVRAKLKPDAKVAEADIAEELKQFDALFAKHKDEKTDDVANILFSKAILYLQVLDNQEKAEAIIRQIKKDFPETRQGKNADQVLDSLKKQAEAKKIQASLVEGAKFPDFEEKDLDGKPLSIAAYKGKIVLVDFWATWCGPCVQELPNVIKAYEKHHAAGFEIIGISLDRDRDEQKLKTFLKDKGMTWQQFFDGKGWSNKLASKYGVVSIPATYLLNGEGKIIGKDLRGEALEAAVAKALPKK